MYEKGKQVIDYKWSKICKFPFVFWLLVSPSSWRAG